MHTIVHMDNEEMTPGQRQVARAIASNKRRGQNRKADDLIAAGWVVYTPEGERYDGTQRGCESRPRKT